MSVNERLIIQLPLNDLKKGGIKKEGFCGEGGVRTRLYGLVALKTVADIHLCSSIVRDCHLVQRRTFELLPHASQVFSGIDE